MRLVSCQIENFGKLSNTKIDFDKRIHVINQDNAWGKSTLATFIKVMLFGFANEGKRSEVENERKKYKPWQGGTYGGRLVFETNGKVYEIVRTFGTKDKEDTFALYDAKTNLPVDDYTSELGEELFGIDRESFCRSAFIGQLDCQTQTTDSIHAKIGNLTDNTDDINNYESVQAMLRDLLNKMTPKRKTGAISKLEDEIAVLKSELSRTSANDQSIEELKAKINEARTKRNAMVTDQRQLQVLINDISDSKVLWAKKENYEHMCKEEDNLRAQLDREVSAFPGEIPDEQELADCVEVARNFNNDIESLSTVSLTSDEKDDLENLEVFFDKGVPTKEMIEECKEKALHYDTLRNEKNREQLSEADLERHAALADKFANGIPDKDNVQKLIDRWSESKEKRRGLLTLRGVLEKQKHAVKMDEKDAKNEEERIENQRKTMFFIGVGVIVLGIAAGIFVMPALFAVALIGAIIIWFSKVSYQKNLAKHKKNIEERGDQSGEIATLERQINDEEDFVERTYRDTQKFFQTYGYEFKESSVLDVLHPLQSEITEFTALDQRKKLYENSSFEEDLANTVGFLANTVGKYFDNEYVAERGYYNSALDIERMLEKKILIDNKNKTYLEIKDRTSKERAMLNTFFDKYDIDASGNMEASLRKLLEHLKNAKRLDASLRTTVERKLSFEKDIDVTLFTNELREYAMMDLEPLQQKMDNLIESINVTGDDLTSYQKQLNGAVAQQDELIQIKADLEERIREKEALVHKYEIIEQTSSMLEKSKENFTSQYMSAITASFGRYYKMLTGQDAEDFRVDANINISTSAYGEERSIMSLSAGYQDLIGLCMRIALVDAMYEEENPFVVFDDPFVNLDSEKVEGGLNLIDEISKKYQVIYFTCHDSRDFVNEE